MNKENGSGQDCKEMVKLGQKNVVGKSIIEKTYNPTNGKQTLMSVMVSVLLS